MSANTKTMAIKSRVANCLRKDFYKKDISDFTPDEKIAYFDNLVTLVDSMHRELNNYRSKRRNKAEIASLRAARGWKPTKKTSFEEYQKMSMTIAH